MICRKCSDIEGVILFVPPLIKARHEICKRIAIKIGAVCNRGDQGLPLWLYASLAVEAAIGLKYQTVLGHPILNGRLACDSPSGGQGTTYLNMKLFSFLKVPETAKECGRGPECHVTRQWWESNKAIPPP